VACALQRRESRGLHYSADYPLTQPSECRPSLVSAPMYGSRSAVKPGLVPAGSWGGGGGAGAGGLVIGSKGTAGRQRGAAARDLKLRATKSKTPGGGKAAEP